MKLSYGFMCDFCGKYMVYEDKTSVRYEKYAKSSKYNIVKTTDTISAVAVDLCPVCAKRLSKSIDRYIIFEENRNAYKKVCDKHMKKVSENREKSKRMV